MKDNIILTTSPSITKKEIDYVNDAITNGHGEHWGDYIKRFEKQFAEYIGVKHAMATSSCTGAMHLALVALGVKAGDEVIVPDLTWIATASAVTYVGATPIFADVLEDSWCIDPESIRKLISNKTRAIIPVHLYGTPSDMDSICDIADNNDPFINVIEDAAPSVGAEYFGNKTGSFGDIGCFSFQGAKMLSTGEGGMIVTNNDGLFEEIKHFADHGRSGNGFDISDIGFKYKMSNLQAAWGCAQLDRVDELLFKKRLIFSWYHSELSDIEGIKLNIRNPFDIDPSYWMSSIVLNKDFGVTRDALMTKLKLKGIDTRPFFPPISSFRMFSDANNPVAKRLSDNGVNLPSGHDLTYYEVKYICHCIKDILGV